MSGVVFVVAILRMGPECWSANFYLQYARFNSEQTRGFWKVYSYSSILAVRVGEFYCIWNYVVLVPCLCFGLSAGGLLLSGF